jgi:hypothetical protein
MTGIRHWRKGTRLPVAGGILVMALLTLAIVQACGGGDDTTAAPTAAPTKEAVGLMGEMREKAQQQNLYPDRPGIQDADTDLADGGSARLATWDVKATFEKTTDSIDGSVKASPGNRFVLYRVIVTNQLESKSIHAGREFKLIDPQGTVVDHYGGLEIISGGEPDPVAGEAFIKVVPATPFEGILRFEVSEQSGWHYLIFDSRIPGPGRLVWGIELP